MRVRTLARATAGRWQENDGVDMAGRWLEAEVTARKCEPVGLGPVPPRVAWRVLHRAGDANPYIVASSRSGCRGLNRASDWLQTLAVLAQARENEMGHVFRRGERQETSELP